MAAVKGISLEQGHTAQVTRIKLLGWLFIFAAYICNQIGGQVGTPMTTTIYFLFIAIGFALFALADTWESEYKWVFRSIAECALWNIVDELMGQACVISKWEIIGAMFIFVGNYLFAHKTKLKKFYVYFRKSRR